MYFLEVKPSSATFADFWPHGKDASHFVLINFSCLDCFELNVEVRGGPRSSGPTEDKNGRSKNAGNFLCTQQL